MGLVVHCVQRLPAVPLPHVRLAKRTLWGNKAEESPLTSTGASTMSWHH